MDEKESTSELVVVDVKRYKKVKLALKESEQRYRQLFENVPIGIYRTTPDGRIVDANPALVKMLGYGSFEELSTRNLEKEYSNSETLRADFIKRLNRDGEIIGLEAIWSRKDGSRIYVRENAKLTQTDTGEVMFEGTVEDITLKKQAEAAQKVRTQQLEMINLIISLGNRCDSLEELLDSILDQILKPQDFHSAAIFIYDAVLKKMNVAAYRGVTKSFFHNNPYNSVERMPFLQLLQSGQPVFVDHCHDVIPDLARKYKWQMIGSIPMLAKGLVVGAINVACCNRAVFSHEEKHLLELIGKEAGTLISKLQTESALRESEKYYRTLIDTSPDVIAVTDLLGNLHMVNQRFIKLSGFCLDEIIGKNSFDFVADFDRELFNESLKKFIKTGNLRTIEYNFKNKNGDLIPLELSASLLLDAQGKPGGLIGFGRDVSERKHSEDQLRFLSSITENTSEAITVTDTRFAITYVNKVAEKFFGYTLDELKGQTPDIFNAEPQAGEVQKHIYETISSGKIYLGESLNRRKDGSTFYCEYKVMPMKDSNGEIYAYSSVQRDISERKRNEEMLRQSEDSFRCTFEAIPDPAYIWTRHADGRMRLSKFNQAAAEITRDGIQNYLGVDAEKLFAGHPAFVNKIDLALNSGERQFSEVLYQFQTTGESRWLQVDYVKTAGDSVLVITKDISSRKEAESKLLAYQEQLRALTSELTLIEERERRRIASELHDQIGQNLALCKLKVAALEKNLADETARTEMASVRRLLECSIQDTRSLIFDLSPPVLYELGLIPALEWLAERIQEQFRIPVECENRSGNPELGNDQRVILFQAVRELLLNVGKHSRAGQGKVILSREAQFLKIQVNDDGVGFDVARIFAPADQSGGFGFFSMRERLNYLGGGMEVRSKPGHGSQIVLLVPLKSGAAAPAKENP